MEAAAVTTINPDIEESWKEQLKEEFSKDADKLNRFIREVNFLPAELSRRGCPDSRAH